MIFYNDIIEVNIFGNNLLQVKLARFLLDLQCSTFVSSISLKEGKKILFNINLCKENSLNIVEEKSKFVINLRIDSPYKVVLSYLLQIWSIINNLLLVHGGIYREGSKDYIVTGEGGVGKTHKIITSCLNKKQPFMGDDLVLLIGKKALPIIRPLCVYPEHKNIKSFNDFIAKNIKQKNVLSLKIKRKILAYLASIFPQLNFLYINSNQREFSNSTWAYIHPNKLGMEIFTGIVEIFGFITLVRSNKNVKISNDVKDTIQGTMYEFECFDKQLDILVRKFYKISFYEYIKNKFDLIRKNS